MSKLRVTVLMGGESSEREISLMTGREMVNKLDRGKYEVEIIELPRDISKIKKGMGIALLALHGSGGEDGKIQGYLETLGIKYTGCGVLASAVGMNKRVFRELMSANKVLVPRLVTQSPGVVKPVNGGSSIGVSIVRNKDEMEKAIELAKKYDDQILIEEYIKGREFTCGILAGKALPVVEIRPKNEFFDFESKYTESGAEEICPAKISQSLKQRIQKISEKVFNLIDGRGYGRVDLIVEKNRIYVLEINTLPGMTALSLLPKEAREIGMSYSQLLDRLIELAS